MKTEKCVMFEKSNIQTWNIRTLNVRLFEIYLVGNLCSIFRTLEVLNLQQKCLKKKGSKNQTVKVLILEH